ncbi:glycosyltransferase family 4 protein [Dehalobacter sp. DCM]|uniref:glycosyltransferase family 4 protein n=1 Tax=Dehalobacter sp. DCM TaxID=2907827 RepID=UPI003081BA80|nr:glycosyltransferase family 4 protein [Dehalobacter sp. DCM]
MKILVLSHMYPSAVNPVYGIFIQKQVEALIQLGHEVRVIAPVPLAPWPLSVLKSKWRSYAAIPKRDRIADVDVYYPRYLEFPRSFLREHSGTMMARGIQRLVREIRQEFSFDVIHAHVALPDGGAAVVLKESVKVPVVVTIHGQDFQSTIHIRQSLRQKVFAILNKADRIITVSTKLQRLVQDQPFAGKITVINNGIDLEDVVAVSPEAKGTLDNRLTTADNLGGDESSTDKARTTKMVVSVSNLKKTKGIDLNIEAVARIIQDYPNLIYHIVGDGEERQSLEDLVNRLNLQEHVVFLGKLPHAETMKQIAAADIFCLPSWQEGFGAVYIEAMSQGVPTIGVRGEGIEDAISHGQNGLLVRPQNVNDIVDALNLLLFRPDRARALADAGRQTVLHSFTWEHCARKTIAVYEQLLTTADENADRRIVP